MKTLVLPYEPPSADPELDQPIDSLDDYVNMWLDHARAGRAISALRDAHITMLKSELSSLRQWLHEPRP